MKTDLSALTIVEANKLLNEKEISVSELTSACLDKTKELNPKLNSFLEIFDDAVGQAKTLDEEIVAGRPVTALTGIPLAIKDNILINGRLVSAASKMLENYRATYDATVIQKLKNNGAIFLGRTNMDEFAMGGSTENSAFGPAKNPHDLERVTGGSSGGSAAAVAAQMALGAIGSDTGGSIRQPAALCGVVGLKPTYGSVSRYGLMAMASSLDQIGPFGKTVADAEIIFRAIAGRDDYDATSRDSLNPAKQAGKLKIGVPEKILDQGGLDKEVVANFEATIEKLKNLGHEIKTVSLTHLKHSLAVYYIIMPAEASTNLARFDGVRYGLHVDGDDLLGDYRATRAKGFGPEVRRRIMLGTYVLSAGYYDAFYNKAVMVRELIRRDYEEAFKSVDLIATPTAPNPAFKIGEKTTDPLTMYLEDIFTVPANLTGLPAISVPSGKTETGLPLGFQLTAPMFAEDLLFQAGKDIES